MVNKEIIFSNALATVVLETWHNADGQHFASAYVVATSIHTMQFLRYNCAPAANRIEIPVAGAKEVVQFMQDILAGIHERLPAVEAEYQEFLARRNDHMRVLGRIAAESKIDKKGNPYAGGDGQAWIEGYESYAAQPA